MYRVRSSLFRFLAVGALSTLVNYAAFATLLIGMSVAYVPASVLGYVAGMILGYLLNRSWSFSATSNASFKEATYYASVYVGSLGLNALSLFVLVEYGGIAPLVGNIFAITLSTATNYLGLRYVVFCDYGSKATTAKSTIHE